MDRKITLAMIAVIILTLLLSACAAPPPPVTQDQYNTSLQEAQDAEARADQLGKQKTSLSQEFSTKQSELNSLKGYQQELQAEGN